MKLPLQHETASLIGLAENDTAMRLLHAFPRKIVKLLCQALKTEHEMRTARDRRITALLNELRRREANTIERTGSQHVQ